MDRPRAQSKARRIKRMVPLAIVAIAVVGGGVTLANVDFKSFRVDRDAVTIEAVQSGTLEVTVVATGQLLPRNIEYLASEVTGRVAKAYVKPGALVEVGQLLVELTNPQLVATAEEAQSAWEGAVADLRATESELQNHLLDNENSVIRAKFDMEKAQLELEAQTKLIKDKIISEMDYQRSKLNVGQLSKVYAIEESRLQNARDSLKVQLAVKESRVRELARALDRAKDQAASLKIVAGIAGIVQAVDVEVGQQLQPGSPVGRIAQQEQLYAELKVPAREATGVEVGQNVVIDTRSSTVNGTVARVDPGVTDGTVIVDVDLPGTLPAGARPQLQVEGVIYLSQLPNTLYVGKPAYFRPDADMVVYKLDPAGRYATRVTIKAGKASLNQLQVLQGLNAGDRIITSEVGEWQDRERILLN